MTLVLLVLVVLVIQEGNSLVWVADGRSSRRAPQPVCSYELLDVCQRIENRETALLRPLTPDQMVILLRACARCGNYPRISGTLLPGAEDLARIRDEVRAQMSR